ncbi:hypothetical protein D3H55_04170 [Bacillus salacetis]|uniref:YtxH domain-containing protein n=1 Tax=Bacillus salacetis TaxID=2315464 RepID=A0A3A1R3E8_9BACI|nr:hypothetical protein [Bacillus salacetis]RIW37245.1 hypothetical protein D3H55_04170 [Bacillus salacetis]
MSIRKTLLMSAAAAGGAYLSKKENRAKVKGMIGNLRDQWKNGSKDSGSFEKAGNPHPHDVEDNTMVSEGAQTSVHYYNSTVQ